MALWSEPRLALLRERLEAERAQGAPFAQAWERASSELMAELGGGADRSTWRSVLKATRPAWRSAYYGGRSSRVTCALSELEAYAADGELEPLRYEQPLA